MAIALALAFPIAKANATVTYQIGSVGLETVGLNMPGVYVGNALAGGISIQQLPANNNSSMPSYYVTVCRDIGATLYLGQTYTYDSPATPFAGQSGINPLWGTGLNDGSAAKAIQNAAYIFNTFGQLTSTGLGGDADLKTAIQLAVWDVLYNTDVNGSVVAGARFSYSGVDSGVSDDLASFGLASLTGNYNLSGSLLVPDPLLGGINANGDGKSPQELLIQSVPVPESTTIIAGALLLLPLGASTFRILSNRRAV